MGQRGNAFRQGNAVPVAAALGSIHTGLQAGTGRAAHRLAGKVVLKEGALFGQLHQVRGHRFVDGIPPLLIAEVEDDVLTLCHVQLLFLNCTRGRSVLTSYLSGYKAGDCIIDVQADKYAQHRGKYPGDDLVIGLFVQCRADDTGDHSCRGRN
jgi:hypothetical protein